MDKRTRLIFTPSYGRQCARPLPAALLAAAERALSLAFFEIKQAALFAA
jgi:hypothetical protein